jgi:broad specificity phosphatase PhoE
LIRRVAAWCDGPERGEGRVLAITHPAVMRAALVHALGAGAAAYWRIDVAPLSRLILSRQGANWRLQALEKLGP